LRKFFSKKSEFPEEVNMKRKVIFSSSTIDEINTSENPNSTLNIISSYFPKIDIVKSNNFTNMNIFNNINVQYEYIEDGKYEK